MARTPEDWATGRRNLAESRTAPSVILPEEWKEARKDFDGLLREIGANDIRSTTSLVLFPIRVDVQDSRGVTAAYRQQPGVELAFRGAADDNEVLLYAYETGSVSRAGEFGAFLWIEPHSRLSAWLLMTAWRLQQLIDATTDLLQPQPLAALCTGRALLETAAALRHDVRRLDAIWQRCREEPPLEGRPVTPAFSDLRAFIGEVLFAGRWQHNENPYKELNRVNVLTALEKLSRDFPDTLKLYEWLCNVVHPSVGSTLLFSPELATKSDGTEVVLRHDYRAAYESGLLATLSDSTVVALTAGRSALDDGVRILDDIGLSTQCSHLARFSYWRQFERLDRNQRCPCRSGRKAKDCSHRFGYDRWMP